MASSGAKEAQIFREHRMLGPSWPQSTLKHSGRTVVKSRSSQPCPRDLTDLVLAESSSPGSCYVYCIVYESLHDSPLARKRWQQHPLSATNGLWGRGSQQFGMHFKCWCNGFGGCVSHSGGFGPICCQRCSSLLGWGCRSRISSVCFPSNASAVSRISRREWSNEGSNRLHPGRTVGLCWTDFVGFRASPDSKDARPPKLPRVA